MMNKKTLPLLVIFSLVPLGPLAIDVYLPSFPQMVDVFNVSESDIRLTISIYVLALGVSQLFAGAISDKKGRRFSALIGLFLYALGSLLIINSSALYQLYGGRIVQGIGASFTMITAMAWIRDNYEGKEAGKWMSYIGGVTSAVPTIAPLIGSGLALQWGWTSGFWLMVSVAFVLFMASLVVLKPSPSSKPTLDISNPQKLKCNIKDILTNRTFTTYALANTLSFGALLTYISVAPIVAMKEGGFTQIEFSIAFGLVGGVQIISSFIAPIVMGKVGRKNTVRLGASVIVAGGVGLLTISSNNTLAFFVMSAMGASGFSLLSGSATSLALEPFKYCAGLAASIDGFLRMIGGAILAGISSLLIANSIAALAIVLLLSILSILNVTLDKRKSLEMSV